MISDEEIRRAVSDRAFEAGLQYQLEGRVQDLRVLADGVTLEATVDGSGRSSYRQSIHLTRGPAGRLQPQGLCTCPIGFNCKHVAAALLEYQEEMVASPARAVTPAFPGKATMDRRDHMGDRGVPTLGHAPSDIAVGPLPYEVDQWLRSLDAAQQEDSEDYPPTVRKRLLYVLERRPHTGDLLIGLHSIELKRDGSASRTSTRHQPDQLLRNRQQPKFLRPSDRILLRQIMSIAAGADELVPAAIQGIVATGRGRWAACDGPALSLGPDIAGELAWKLSEDGRQYPDLVLPDRLLAFRLATPWYVDPATGVVGPVETTLPSRLIRALLAGPALSPEVAGRVREEMGRRWPGRDLPTPKTLAPPRVLREPVQPHLLLFAGEIPLDPAELLDPRGYRAPTSEGPYRVALARLTWHYGPIALPGTLPFQAERMLHHDGTLIRLLRDRTGEERATEIVYQLGLVRLGQFYLVPPNHPHAGDLIQLNPDLDAWIDLVLEDIRRLRDQGWRINIADDFPWRIVEPTGELSFEVTERPDLDWFDVELGIVVEGERISVVPALLEVISTIGIDAVSDLAASSADDDDAVPLLLKLPDGRLLNLSIAQLRPILSPLLELFADADVQAGSLRLPKRNAADLALLEEASAEGGIAWTGGEALRALGRQLRDHGGIPAYPVPSTFGAELRPYQAHGLAWLQFLRSAGLGGVLADDMGLGKTVQALAHLIVEQAQGRTDLPSLVICPTSLVPNWLAEATRFAPGLRCLVLHGPQRALHFGDIGAHELVITTYPLLARDHALLTGQAWHVVILDEAQTIKNPLATTSKLARTLRARQRLCLSGTPLENHLGELWSLFDFLLPNWLGDRQHFGRRYRGPIEKAGNTERLALLVKRISPFLLRRTKELVASELPPKTEITESVEMGAAQRGIYDGIRLAMHAKVRAAIAKRGMAGSGIVILDALLKLRQTCCDPRLLKLAAAKTAKARSAKLERLLKLLPQMLEEGRRVLLFSQFTSMLALIEAELTALGVPYVLLTGDTRDRTAPVRKFQSGAVPLFLISLKAGGVGLNLTAADTVIHYDPWWNPAVENQATDRAHRIGQDKPVFVHRLIIAGTIEEKMDVLKQRKQALADGIFADRADAMSTLTEADLDMLFAG